MSVAIKYLPFVHDAIEARLVHGWLVDGFVGMEPLWFGHDGARGKDVIVALAAALAANENRLEDGLEGDDDDDDALNGDELFTLVSLEKLRTAAPSLLAGSMGGAIKQVIGSLKPSHRAALNKFGYA
jgi:hypothetical protein